ncbi:hypothetical protein ACP70R_024223 [Stipagrostis hirtigluma subsp. patula]
MDTADGEDMGDGAKRMTPSPTVDHGADGADLISGLPDDVLLRILGQVGDARDVVRTDALSRRWRGLWTRVPALRFDNSRPGFRPGFDDSRFVSFVDDVLALRAQSGDGIELLAISFTTDVERLEGDVELVSMSIRDAQEWIKYAVRHEVKYLIFEFHLDNYQPLRDYYHVVHDDDGPVMSLLLGSPAKLETMHLDILGVKVDLPATAVFASLVELKLESIVVAGRSSDLFARLVSSECCPRLQKLSMSGVELEGVTELLLDSGSLAELWLKFMWMERHERKMSLELRTPSLRLTFVRSPSINIDGDLSSVWRLKLGPFDGDMSDTGIHLLRRCSSIRCLHMSIYFVKGKSYGADIIKGGMSQLSYVTSLKLDIFIEEAHSLGDGLASLFTVFSNLRYLRLDLFSERPKDLICNHQDHWKSQKISLVHLQEVELRGLRGINCELRFLQLVLASATQLQKMFVRFDRHHCLEGTENDFLDMLLGGGTWMGGHISDAGQSYTWRPRR